MELVLFYHFNLIKLELQLTDFGINQLQFQGKLVLYFIPFSFRNLMRFANLE